MRHRNVNKILDRKKGPREALLRSLTTSLILYEKVKTTDAKAAAVRPIVERLITKGKVNNLASRRYLLSRVYGDNVVKKILEELAPRYKDRKGGYTRIIKISARSGDAAKIVQIEFV